MIYDSFIFLFFKPNVFYFIILAVEYWIKVGTADNLWYSQSERQALNFTIK